MARFSLFASSLMVVSLAGCPQAEKPAVAPSGPAGAPVGAGQMPTAAASMPAAGGAMGAPSSQPAKAAAAAAPSSMPAAGGAGAAAAMPQVVKGNAPPPAPPAPKATYAGTVAETMNAAGYTYMKVTTGAGQEVWAAVGETKVDVGQKVNITESLTMTDFHSKTLNRTFPTIIFATMN